MFDLVRKTWALLSAAERRELLLLMPLMLGVALLDMIGVASIMPFVAVLANPSVIESNGYLNWMYKSLGFTSQQDFLSFLALVFFALLVVSLLFKAISTYVISRYTQMREYSIGRSFVRRFLAQPYDWFLNQNSSDLGTSILLDVSRVVGSIIIPSVNLVVQGALVIALLGLLIIVQPIIAITVGSTLVVTYVLIYLALRSYLRRLGTELQVASNRRFRIVSEAFVGIKSVKVAGLEEHYASQFEGSAFAYARTIAASNVASQAPRLLLELLAFGGTLAVMAILIRDYASFQNALPVLTVYVLASYRLMPAMQQIYQSVSTLRFAAPTLEKLYAQSAGLLDAPPARADLTLDLTREVRLDAASYRYPGSSRVNIAGLDLTIPVRSSIGLVGATGSGKTTTVDLILGLLQPTQGRLMVDDCEIDASNRGSWQRLIGYVPQQIFLIDDTIAANIAYGVRPELVDHDAVVAAARAANLEDFIVGELPEQYQTVVGERGVRLSGGQMQRIGIARALYHKPRLLVLDEATSALDTVTEASVMDAINRLGHQVTLVIIAHRISTVRSCDRIYVLDHGRIVDSGTFEELASREGRFREMVTGG